ncbi:hypothetical protein [Ciceribacter sp. L1K22]|uniref:hypothetical protein n=1 Tax=Ciceribacter sp. L1K22 TaxID=2820275 RepID=UPI001ABE4399|nr:hypothetical protein [Ciceribacter sp. L1K22]MBO3760087.1 hypothetical protein [Ciceribacter sp. L1K22]
MARVDCDLRPPAIATQTKTRRYLPGWTKALFDRIVAHMAERRERRQALDALDSLPLDLRKDLGWPDMERPRRRE